MYVSESHGLGRWHNSESQDDEIDEALVKVRCFTGPQEILMKPRFLLKYAAFALRKRLGMVPSGVNTR